MINKKISITLGLILLGLLGIFTAKNLNSASANNDTYLQSYTQDAEVNLPMNHLEYLIEGLQELSELKNYRIDYTLLNTRNNKRMSHAIIIGNEEGDLDSTFYFYNDNFDPDTYGLRLLTYDNFELAYMSQFAFLESMAFFDQPHFNFSFDQNFDDFQETFVEIKQDNIHRNYEEENSLLELLLLLPDLEKLAQVDPDHVETIQNYYFLNLHRLEIPEFLMRDINNLTQSINTSLSIREDNIFPVLQDVDWIGELHNELQIGMHDRGLDFEVNFRPQLSNELLPTFIDREAYNSKSHMNSELYVRSSDIVDKLTDVRISYDKERQYYRITLMGITESFNLNLFRNQTANFRSYEFQIDFSIQPTEETVPEIWELNRMSEEEFNYLLSTLVNRFER